MWNNHGHIYDEIYKEIKEKLCKINISFIYDCGYRGEEAKKYLESISKCRVGAFIDKTVTRKDVNGIPVYTLENIETFRHNELIFVATNYYDCAQVVVELKRIGLCEWKDFVVYDKLKALLGVYEKNYLRIELAEFPITEKCTLNCRKCSFFTPYYSAPSNYKKQEICRSIDLIFKNVDFIETLRFLGGEPPMSVS